MRIAVIGSGISGLTAAYLLRKAHHVHVFEKEDWLGGHTHTVGVDDDGALVDVDTGFIVFNDKTYPNFIKLLHKLDVKYEKTTMSFSVCNRLTGLEYNGSNLDGLFLQRKNILKWRHLYMIYSILKFNKSAQKYLSKPLNMTLQEYILHNRIDDYTVDNYLLPMCCSIWSCPKNEMLLTPVKFLFEFLNNHGLLSINDRPQWYFIKGGSHSYVKKIMSQPKINFHKNEPVFSVIREGAKIKVVTELDQYQFDKVIMATHADDTLKIMRGLTDHENEILGQFKYQDNEVILHSDIAVLPKEKKAWSAWNFRIDLGKEFTCSLSYNMNILQKIKSKKDLIVSVNQSDIIEPTKIMQKFTYAHPIYSQGAFESQPKQSIISGKNNTFYCGAYWGYGFHEDGVKSALHISQLLGGELL
jgi:uncharacterized protein